MQKIVAIILKEVPIRAAISEIMLLSQGGSKVRITFTEVMPLIFATLSCTSSSNWSAIGQFGAVSVMRMLATPSGSTSIS